MSYSCPRCKVPGRVGKLGADKWFCHSCNFQWEGGPYGGWDTPPLTLASMNTLSGHLTSIEYSRLEKEIAEGDRLLKQALKGEPNAR
jgi:hypothetical protein